MKRTVSQFLKPNWLKLLFLIELPAFLFIELHGKGIPALQNSFVFLAPLGLYYLVACVIIYFHNNGKQLTGILYLIEWFQQDKIYQTGHSWGSHKKLSYS